MFLLTTEKSGLLQSQQTSGSIDGKIPKIEFKSQRQDARDYWSLITMLKRSLSEIEVEEVDVIISGHTLYAAIKMISCQSPIALAWARLCMVIGHLV